MVQKLCGAIAPMKTKIKLMAKTCVSIILTKMLHGFVVLFADKRSNLFITIFFLVGCNQKLQHTKMVSIDPSLQPYADQFVAAGQASGHNIVIDDLSMHFAPSADMQAASDVVGECFMMNNGQDQTPILLIDSDFWATISEPVKQGLTFHELGHCVLFLYHDTVSITTSLNDYIPRSIMYPYISNEIVYITYWLYYTNELFNGISVPTP